MKKAEFNFTNFFIGLIIFSLIVGALYLNFYSEIGKNYDVKVDAKYNKTYNKMDRLNNETLSLVGEIKDDPGTFDTFVLAAKIILSVPRRILSMLSITQQVMTDFAADVGIPPIFLSAAIILITTMIAFFIVSLWARYRT